MNPFHLHAGYRECLAVFVALKAMGFHEDDIFFFVAGRHGPRQIGMVLRTQDKEHTSILAIVDDTPEHIRKTWQSLCVAANENKISERHMDRLYRQSMVRSDPDSFVNSIMDKGIVPPLLKKTAS